MLSRLLPPRLLWRALRRDLGSGALRVIVFALIVAVGAITAVGVFTDRVARGMSEQASNLLGADLVLGAADAIPGDVRQEARRLGLRAVDALGFPSVVLSGEHTLLVMVRALGSGYPLLGDVRLSERPFGPERTLRRPPRTGTVWLSREALTRLGLAVGDSLHLGEARLRIAGIVREAPGTGAGLFDFAPRLILSLSDVASTGLVTPQSRVRHELMLAGAPAAVDTMRRWLSAHAPVGMQVEDVRSGRPTLRTALDRAQRFLSLAALAAALLGGGAIAVAAASFARREADQSALMRCLGASGARVLRLAVWRLLGVGLIGSLGGLALGALAQWGLSALLAGWFATQLPLPGWQPFAVGLASGLILMLGFGLVPVLQVGRVPPLRVLRRQLGAPTSSVWGITGAALLAMAGLLRWQTGNTRLSMWMVGGGLVTVAVSWAVAYGLMRGLARGHARGSRFGWRYGLRSLGRRGLLGAVQLAAVGLGLSTLLLLAFVRGDLLDAWQRSLPTDTPNQFAINIQTDQRAGVRALFQAHGLPPPHFYPMVRARLVSINGKPVRARDYADAQARRLVRREFNLSWASHLQQGNRLVAGRWWADDRAQGFSVDQGLARTLGIRLGDRLGFETAGQAFAGTVESLRDVRWDTFRPNFFVLTPPGMLEGLPVSWITSFYLPPGHAALLPALVRAYPGVTLFDVDRLLAQVRAIIERGVQAVEYVFAFALLAGLIVLYAAIDASQPARRRELAVLRALGASRTQMRLALAAEFAGLGILAGVIASASASLLGYVLATRIFDLDYVPDPGLWLAGVASGMLLVLAVGLWGTRTAARVPPQAILQTPD
ncbi:ABC transporter permease [Acidihalobacter prosperus]|uniref:ABC3 transporter permease protein domain-containing protein n=1 Tax=Acidihalobacter prosperus TaxID=160660 RepID=A0A1A6C8T8_9GAMM|nr:FtsX-like permease family protein [Acidihalobacter prosperus]OBS10971.1 hypothetical protein Thpro_020687 [Acidihalobacter prosperus]